MRDARDIPGFAAPVRQALTQPILMGGAPRSYAILNGTLAAVVAFAILTLFAPLASWIVALITDPLGTKARVRHRTHIDAIYPAPDLRERRRYAET
ncbi:MAG TPA: VirB3 family type IV secretion system protein [Caulobacterales bacterium]|jgi:type IV secretory pathway TrbD component|nr:VirB3 family type IV secretion system protein [Caulobacterales bacterium]